MRPGPDRCAGMRDTRREKFVAARHGAPQDSFARCFEQGGYEKKSEVDKGSNGRGKMNNEAIHERKKRLIGEQGSIRNKISCAGSQHRPVTTLLEEL
eukprot:763327-Hanusia_phi.AAC.3